MRRRFNARAGFRKIRLQDEGTATRNCDAIFFAIALIRFMIFASSRRIGAPRGKKSNIVDGDHRGENVVSIVDTVLAGRRAALSGELAFAAKAQIFLRFHPRHPQQVAEHVELVALGQPGEIR